MSDFNDKQLEYIEWLAQSKYDRVPGTEQLFANRIGVTDRTLRRWKQTIGFREAVTKRARELLGDDLPEIYGSLRREAIKGNFQHIKLALELVGEHTDRLDVNVSNISDTDIIREFTQLLNAARERAGSAAVPGD